MQKKAAWSVLYLSVVAFAAIAYRMELAWIIGICLAAAAFLPLLMIYKKKQRHEDERFLAVSEYMEQMLYAFKANGKILQSLEDVMTMMQDEPFKQTLIEASNIIKYSVSGKNVYEEALEHINENYPNERLRAMHRFMMQVETYGGEFDAYADLLLSDRAFWVEQVMLLQKEVRGMHVKVCIAIGLTCFMCGVGAYLLPMQMEGVFLSLSHIVSASFLLMNIWIYVTSTKRIAVSWLERDISIAEDRVRKYENEMKRNKKYSARYRLALKKMSQAIDIAFPQWLMEMALLLQRSNVQMAIRQTRRYAPAVLQTNLAQLDHRFETEPDAIEPYVEFMKEYEKPHIQQAMKMFYAVSQNGQQEVQEQIAILLKRNQKMMDQAEKIKNDHVLAGMTALYLVPMLIGALKLMFDMTMFLLTFMGQLHF